MKILGYLIFLAPLTLLVMLVASVSAGCGNPTSKRQQIINTFGTADVFALHNDNYIARDTNGAVWFVDARMSTNYCTMIFGPWK